MKACIKAGFLFKNYFIDEQKTSLEIANSISKNTLMETLEIYYIDVGDDFLKARMPVSKKVHQPDGILHGGATAALAESVGSAAVYIFNKDSNTKVRGIEIAANHIKSISDGFVYATARPIHWGKNYTVLGNKSRKSKR